MTSGDTRGGAAAVIVASVVVAASACGGSGPRDRVAVVRSSAPATGTTPLRRLTRDEYDNTVRDLLGDTRGLAASFAPDTHGPSGFTTGGPITGVEMVQYMEAADALAAAAVQRLDVLLPCQPRRIGEERCAAELIRVFGKRAWRRPLDRREAGALLDLYRQTRAAGGSFPRGVRAVLAAFLQAPAFLYHVERPAAGPVRDGLVALSPYEIASRLSYFLWATMPDATLFALADTGALSRPDVIEAQARRMLADPRARAGVTRWQADWLVLAEGEALEKDRKRFPQWNEELAAAVEAETPRFVSRVVLEGDARLHTLLTARYTWVDAPLARHYGLPAPAPGTVAKVSFDPRAGRAGLLTHALLLARNASASATSPTRRGVLIRERLMCQTLPPPPPDTDTTPPSPKAEMSVREQIADHAIKLACSECHDRIDPLGFALEGFDAVGRPQEVDGGKPIDVTATLEGTDVDGPIAGAAELGQRLASSEEVRRCVARQMFRYALGRRERDDETSFRAAYQAFRASDFNVRELMVALTVTPAFSHRTRTDRDHTR